MPLRRRHRICGVLLLAAFTTAAGDGLLCLIPCFGAATSADGREAIQEPASGGHCASGHVAQTGSEASLGASGACAGDHAIGVWLGERVGSRVSLDSEPGEGLDTILRTRIRCRAALALVRLSSCSSPPGLFTPLRI